MIKHKLNTVPAEEITVKVSNCYALVIKVLHRGKCIIPK